MPVENQGISHQKKPPENPQGDHEGSYGPRVPQPDTQQESDNNNNNHNSTHCVFERYFHQQLKTPARSGDQVLQQVVDGVHPRYIHNPYKNNYLNRQQQGNNTHQQGNNGYNYNSTYGYIDQHGYRHYFDQHGNDRYVDQQGNHHYAHRPGNYHYSVDQQGNYYYRYVDQQGNYYYYYDVDQQGNYYFVPQHLIPRHQYRPKDFIQLFNIYVSNREDIKQIHHGPVPAMAEATIRAITDCFQAVDTTPSDKSVMLYLGGFDGNMGEGCMLYYFYFLLFICVPQRVWSWIKFHYVHCDPAKNMVFACVTDAWAADQLCHHIHHRFFFDTAEQTIVYGPTKDCGAKMFHALQTNNARANGDVAVLVEKNTLRNIVTCEVKDPNYNNRNR